MSILVLGASGATGRFVVKKLLDGNEKVKIVARSLDKIKQLFSHSDNLDIIEGNVLQLSEAVLKQVIDDCSAIVVCLGHHNNFKGIYGKPRMLVHDSLARICHTIEQYLPEKRTIKIVLMNTAGYCDKKNNETLTGKESFLFALLSSLLPPFVDNIKAANYLRDKIGKNHPCIHWVIVRPDSLLDHDNISSYQLEVKPTRSPFFNPGKVSRINVADYIYTLITDKTVWLQWQNQMPVIYNK